MGADWAAACAEAWSRRTRHVPGADAPLSARSAFDVTVAASAPFVLGTRFWALPDVRFAVGTGRMRAPGTLLPGTGDGTVSGYLDRMAAELDAESYLVTVEQPLLLDPDLWLAVRDAVAPLWRLVGWPVLPVVTTLLVGDGNTAQAAATASPSHATLTWVLHGTMGDARAGDLLYGPQGAAPPALGGRRFLALRLDVPMDGRWATKAVVDLLADALQDGRDDSVPYLPFPPDATAEGAVPTAAPVVELAEAMRTSVRAAGTERRLAVGWAARRSAGGLVPVPAPRAAAPVTLEHTVRRTGEVLRLPDGDGRYVWAVNGHTFDVAGSGGDRVLAQLVPDVETPVTDVCDAVGATERPGPVLALLGMLYRLRALDLTGGTA